MGTQYLNTQFRLRRGTAEAWERNNPVLVNGELGWAVDTKVLKIGDGATHWNDLAAYEGTIDVDDKLDGQSTNPVQNKAIFTAFSGVSGTAQAAHLAATNAYNLANKAGGEATSAKQYANNLADKIDDEVAPAIQALTETVENAVLFTSQKLTDKQKTQARKNIGAGEPVVVEDEIIFDENGTPISENPVQSKVIGNFALSIARELENLKKQVGNFDKGRVVYITKDDSTKLASHSPQEIVSLLDEGKIPILSFSDILYFPGYCEAGSGVGECWFFGLDYYGMKMIKINNQKRFTIYGPYPLEILSEIGDWMIEIEELLQELTDEMGELSGTVEDLSSDVEDLSGYIDDIADNILPEITPADEQKLLQVIGGKPAWASVEGFDAAQEPIVVTYSEEGGLSHTNQEIYDLVVAGRVVYFNSAEITDDSLLTLAKSAPGFTFFTGPVDDGKEIQRVEIYQDQVYYYHNELADYGDLRKHTSTKWLEILPQNKHSYGIGLYNEDPHVVEDGMFIETLTFYGSGGDDLVRLRHLAPGSQNDDAVTVRQVMEYAQSARPDWDVEDPEAYSYIKNKPFGRVEQTVLFDGDATFSQPDANGDCYYYFSEPLTLIDGKSYFIENYGYSLCQNGCINVNTAPIFIYPDHILFSTGVGGVVTHFTIIDPEPSYKTLATEYLPMVHNAEIGNMNPISSHGVANIVDAFSTQLGNIGNTLDAVIALQEEVIALQRVFTGEDITIASEELRDYAQNLIEGGLTE